MKTVKLGEVATVERRGIHPDSIDSTTAYLGLEHIESGGRILEHPTVGAASLRSTKFHFSPKHLLYGKLRPYLAKIALPESPGVCSTDILPVLPGPLLDRSYLAHYLRQESMVEFASSRATGANLPRLSPGQLESFPIPLPPLEEQRQIAAILDQADAIRTKRRQVLAHLDGLPSAIFSEYENSTIPAVPLSELVEEHQIGLDRRAAAQGSDREYEYVKMDAITAKGGLQFETMTRVDASAAEVEKYTLQDGDLIFNTRNSRELVGKSAIYRGHPRLYNNNVMRLRFRDSATACIVHAFLWSATGKRSLDSIKSGTTNVFAIYAKDLLRLRVPEFDESTSKTFAELTGIIETRKVSVRAALAKDDALFASLQSRAFKGEL